MAAPYLRGAFVQFMDTFLIPLPNVIIFQFNPESMTHTWTQPEAMGATADGKPASPLAVKGDPGESFSFVLKMDAGDMIADGTPVAEGIAQTTGIYSRLAALEMLMFPTNGGGGLLGSVSASIGPGGVSLGAATGTEKKVSQLQVPTVLFVWGPGRILPVRITGLAITETLYDGFLNPTHAEARVDMRAITSDELGYLSGPLRQVAKGASAYSHGLRQALAVANLGDAVDSIIGMLPV